VALSSELFERLPPESVWPADFSESVHVLIAEQSPFAQSVALFVSSPPPPPPPPHPAAATTSTSRDAIRESRLSTAARVMALEA
jgi:hypothetical protein